MKLNTEANYGMKLNELIDNHGIKEFLILNYFENSDKDYWSLIVSSCQWIQVAESVLENVEDIRGDINIKSFNFFSYIFAIDMMWEAIKKFNSVINQNENLPFKGENVVFRNKLSLLEFEDDNHYFKTLRACFGAHSVDLNFRINPTLRESDRFYASWPNDAIQLISDDNSDFSVMLWPQDKNHSQSTYFIGASINELNEFIQIRYNFIKNIMSEINRQYNEYLISMRKTINIPGTKNVMVSLELLKIESKKRFDLYFEDIEYLDELFKITIEEVGESNYAMLEKYKVICLEIINEIRIELEKFDFDSNNNLISDTLNPNKRGILQASGNLYSYGKEKLSNAYYSNKTSSVLDSGIHSQFEVESFHNNITFNEINTIRGLYHCVIASEYFWNNSETGIRILNKIKEEENGAKSQIVEIIDFDGHVLKIPKEWKLYSLRIFIINVYSR